MGESRRRKQASGGQWQSPRLSSRLLTARASDLTNARLAKSIGTALGQPIGFMVFETTLGKKTVYCCLSGGRLESNGEVSLTEIGRGALEALMGIPDAADTLIMRELKLGPTPLKRKIMDTIESAPDKARICFFGDMAGELDGVVFEALNVRRSREGTP